MSFAGVRRNNVRWGLPRHVAESEEFWDELWGGAHQLPRGARYVEAESLSKKLDEFRKSAEVRLNMKDLTVVRVRKIIQKMRADTVRVAAHIAATRRHFSDPGSPIPVDQIDWPLVFAIAGREVGVTRNALNRTYTSNSAILINTAGRDTHPKGKAGFDNMFKLRRLFPLAVRTELRSVRKDRCRNKVNPNDDEGFKAGRKNTCPALIPEKHLLVGAVVNVAAMGRTLLRHARQVFGSDAQSLLEGLKPDARRVWIATAFARPGGGIRKVLEYYKAKLDAGSAVDLNGIATDAALRKKRGYVRRAVRVSAEAWVLEQSLPRQIREALLGGSSRPRPPDYDCVRPQLSSPRPEVLAESEGVCRVLPITETPTPCRFYTIKRGVDSRGLIALTARSYQVGERAQQFKLAQWINSHPYNHRFWRMESASPAFPKGRISFNPRFTSDVAKQAVTTGRAPSGHSFATIFIPPPPPWLDKLYGTCAGGL